MLHSPDTVELLADYDQYRAGLYAHGYYASDDDIISAIHQRKVFAFKFSNVMVAIGVVLCGVGVFWIWGYVITEGYVITLIPVVIWCGVFIFAGMLGILTKVNGILIVGPNGIIYRRFLTIQVIPWVNVESIHFHPLGLLSDPFKPTIRVQRVGGKALSIIVSQLASPEFPKSFIANGIVTTVQTYHQAKIQSKEELPILKNKEDIPRLNFQNSFLSAVLSGIAGILASAIIGGAGGFFYLLIVYSDPSSFVNLDSTAQNQMVIGIMATVMVIWLVFYAITYILYRVKGTPRYLKLYKVYVLFTIIISCVMVGVFTFFPLSILPILLLIAAFPLGWFFYQLFHLKSIETTNER